MFILGLDRNSCSGWSGSGGIWVSFGPVPVYLAGTRPVPGQERVIKIAARTVEIIYSLKSDKCINVTFHEI